MKNQPLANFVAKTMLERKIDRVPLTIEQMTSSLLRNLRVARSTIDVLRPMKRPAYGKPQG